MSTIQSSRMKPLVKACAFGSLLLGVANAQSLRKGAQDRNLQYGLTPIDSISCQLFALNGQFEDGTEQEIFGCTLNNGDSPLGGKSYSIDLSEEFVNTHRECIMNGACYVDIPGAMVHEEAGSVPTIEVPEATELMPIDMSLSDPTQRNLAVTGDRPVLIVRIRTNDKTCTPSSTDLAGSILGVGNNAIENNMKKQYEGCSNGQLSFFGVTGNSVTNGVVDVSINKDADGTNIFSITNAMHSAASDVIGTSLNYTPKHVMWVVPYGTTFSGSKGWVAFAHVSGFNSWYNDSWGDYLSAQVHEIGHNLGMHHSNENGKAYHDQSDMMGFSYRQKNGPKMCFNAVKNHFFGWYDTTIVDPSSNGAWTGELIAFMDSDQATSNQHVIVGVKNTDTYMQLNAAKGVNEDVQEKANQVVLIAGTRGDIESDVVGSLANPGDVVNLGGNNQVELCSISLGNPSTAVVSIFRTNNQSSGCSTWNNNADDTSDSNGNPNIGIFRFILIDTDTNQQIAWGSKANNMSIRTEVWGNVESVEIVLTGKREHTQQENVAPYMLNGDYGWSRSVPFNLPAGSYTISATAYPYNQNQGWASDTTSFDFVIPN